MATTASTMKTATAMTAATATVTAAMMMTMTVAAPFVAPAIGRFLHCSPPPLLLSLLARCHAITNALVAGGFYRLCRSSCWLVLALSSADRSCHRPAANVRYSIPSSPRYPQTLSSPAAARLCLPVDGWLVHRRLPPMFIVLPLRRRTAP